MVNILTGEIELKSALVSDLFTGHVFSRAFCGHDDSPLNRLESLDIYFPPSASNLSDDFSQISNFLQFLTFSNGNENPCMFVWLK